MALYYVMRPDNAGDNDPNPVFTRYGRLSPNLTAATNRARKCLGRVYEITDQTRLVKDFWVEPKPVPKLPARAYRQVRAATALFSC